MAPKKCSDCVHWHAMKVDDATKSGLQNIALVGEVGQCREAPPRVFLVPGTIAGAIGIQSFWPVTGKADCCGRFMPSRLT